MRQVIKDHWTGGYLYAAEVRGTTIGGWAKDLATAEAAALEVEARMTAAHEAMDEAGLR